MVRGWVVGASMALGVMGFAANAAAAPFGFASFGNTIAEQSDITFDQSPNTHIVPASPALMLEPFAAPSPEEALFTVEEAAVPFLGLLEEDTSRVRIAIEAPGYSDLFTIYFPRGSSHLTLAAEDMIAMAAESVRDLEGVQIWLGATPLLQGDLATTRAAVVYDILLQNDVSRHNIFVDDGGLTAVLNRPQVLSKDIKS